MGVSLFLRTLVHKFSFLFAGSAQRSLTCVENRGKWGLRDDRTGRLVVPYQYDWVKPFSKGFAVSCRGRWGVVDLQGQLVIDCLYDWVDSFDGDRAAVKLNGQAGFVNRQGQFTPSSQVA